MRPAETHSVSGEEQARYLQQLDDSLGVMVSSLRQESGETALAALREFGRAKNWNWSRLPKHARSYEKFSELLERVRQEYRWFATVINEPPNDPSKNRQYYYDSMELSAESGLPFAFALIGLQKLKENAPELLHKLPSYEEGAVELHRILTEDYVPLEEVPAQADSRAEEALKRSFLEQLLDAELLVGQNLQQGLGALTVEQVRPLGGEALWNLAFARYDLANSIFQLYSIDLWQDIREPQITIWHGPLSTGSISASSKPAGLAATSAASAGPRPGKAVYAISPPLQSALRGFASGNAAWFIIKELDERFRSLHPVHVSRFLVGPFENRYLTKRNGNAGPGENAGPGNIPLLPITPQLLAGDANAGLLRCSLQYSYAPNHEVEGKELRQVLYQQDWRQEYIISPAKYSSRVAQSVLGTDVKVLDV